MNSLDNASVYACMQLTFVPVAKYAHMHELVSNYMLMSHQEGDAAHSLGRSLCPFVKRFQFVRREKEWTENNGLAIPCSHVSMEKCLAIFKKPTSRSLC
jgi:hypothetical protein